MKLDPGRVERLHQPLENGIPASTSMGNLILNESQVSFNFSYFAIKNIELDHLKFFTHMPFL